MYEPKYISRVEINWNTIVDSRVCLHGPTVQYTTSYSADNDNLLFNLISDLEFKVLWHVWRTDTIESVHKIEAMRGRGESIAFDYATRAALMSNDDDHDGQIVKCVFWLKHRNVCTNHCGHLCSYTRIQEPYTLFGWCLMWSYFKYCIFQMP